MTPISVSVDGSKNHRLLGILSICATILIAIGSILPWFSIAFSPPGGYAMIDGVRTYAIGVTFNALNGPFPYMGTALFAMFLSNVFFDVPSLFINSEIANRIFDLLSAPIAGLATGIQCVGALSLSFLAIFFGTTSFSGPSPKTDGGSAIGSPSQFAAAHYVHAGLGPGFFFMSIGFVMALVIASISVGARIAVFILIGVVVLFFCGAFGALTNVLQFMGQIDPLHFLGL